MTEVDDEGFFRRSNAKVRKTYIAMKHASFVDRLQSRNKGRSAVMIKTAMSMQGDKYSLGRARSFPLLTEKGHAGIRHDQGIRSFSTTAV